MGSIELQWMQGVSRRNALVALGSFLLGSPQVHAQLDPRPLKGHRRVPGLDEMITAFDFEPVCFNNMPLKLYDYMAHGGDSEWTVARNRQVFDWVKVIPRGGASSEIVDTRTSMFGVNLNSPLMVAPSSRQGDLHPDAEAGMYVGATAASVPMIVANGPSIPHEEIAAAADGLRWIQFYPNPNILFSRRRLERFQATGAQAIVVTVDQQATKFERDLHDRHLGGKWTDYRNRKNHEEAKEKEFIQGPERYGLPVPGRLWYNWDYLDQVRHFVKVPLLIKGVLTAEDARISVDRGFDGIIVSNHGARTLDYVPSSLEVLQEVVTEVAGAIPVLIDSGFRRGRDVFKALALGADAVCLGRAARWGLAAFGAHGVERLLRIIEEELRETMVESGRMKVADIDASAVTVDFP